MKKVCILVACLLLLSCSVPVSAGNIPEELLHDDHAQLFFAQVVDRRTVEGNTQVELIPVKVVKGEVPLDRVLTYDEAVAVGDFTIRKGKAYLVAYFDENDSTRVFRTTGYDPSTLSLVMTEEMRDNMWGRLEKYLNNGSYTAAEAERRQRLGLPEQEAVDSEGLSPLDTGERSSGKVWLFAIAGAIAVAVVGCLCAGVWLRRKRMGRQSCP